MERPKRIPLPLPQRRGKLSLEEVISRRRSVRSFRQTGLSPREIGQLLWAAQGITEKSGGKRLRAAPSAGALFPMELYLLTETGVYHYLNLPHELELVREKDLRRDLAQAAWGQESIKQAPVTFIISAVFERMTAKYGQRSIKYIDIEAGHIAQNIHLQAVAQGLDSVPVGAFNNVMVKKLLSLPEGQEPIYIVPVGHALS
jgi:SagB-type dehydrogenase family enzyme